MRPFAQYASVDETPRSAGLAEGPRPLVEAPPGPEPDAVAEGLHLAMLVKAIEHEIIPRLMLAHRLDSECLPGPELAGLAVSPEDVEQFSRLVLAPDDDLCRGCVQMLRARGISVEMICLDLLAPVARRLGELWEQDLCDFSDVTIGLGRLHQLLRELSREVDQQQHAPANGRRILLAPAPGEQHTFGLVMVGEFFRRSGWDVEAAIGGDRADVGAQAASGWFDVVGYSLAAEIHLEDLASDIAAVRAKSMNPRLCIMVGGALFGREPDRVGQVGADGAAASAREAPELAEKLVVAESLARLARVPTRKM
ncbi:MAG: cobalamin B12-binding domain-containing protein [Comamonadaceae bacterium]|nr:MAG: cobalamin B12-binding domain-containing protein [Comamonadaceae bacterium]